MSLLSRIIAALVVTLLLWLEIVQATSTPARPLKRIARPITVALEIVPRQAPPPKSISTHSVFPPDSPTLRHTDTFRLTIAAFEHIFHLHLRPNDHLIHPAARIRYYRNGLDGKAVLYRTEPLLRESVKAYWGEVIPPQHSHARLREDAAGVIIPGPSGRGELGWARIMVHDQGDYAKDRPPVFEGAFSVNGVVHHIATKENYLRNKHVLDPNIELEEDDLSSELVIWRDSDIMSTEEMMTLSDSNRHMDAHYDKEHHACSHDKLGYNTDPWRNRVLMPESVPAVSWYNPINMVESPNPWDNWTYVTKRDDIAGGTTSNNFGNSIGSINGCPGDQRVVYMGVAADCMYTMQYGTTQNATSQILNDWNSASSLYKTTFNISLGIIHIEVHDPECPSPPDETRPWNTGCGNVTLNDRLSLFSAWRGTLGDDGTGLWHLMSGCPTGTEVGVAWLGTLCQQDASGDEPNVVSGTAVSTNGRTEWQVVSHEVGHNFGAIHDCESGCNSTSPCCSLTTDSCNANDSFIMSPVTGTSQTHFSQCSVGNICSLMLSNAQNGINGSCIQSPNPSLQTISLQMCGNGIVESGEDCDPGPGTNSTCCDSTTCKFTSGAVCDPASSLCCTGQCQFADNSTVCRPSMDAQCDTAEMCTGSSATCPADVFGPNGKSCGPNGLACASGLCTSETLQCQTVGASLNLTTACPQSNDNSCLVSCQDPTNSNQCVQLQAQLVDGTPCGLGGTCSGGNCQAGSALDTAEAWYTQNLQIAIPVTVVGGLVILLLAYAIFLVIRRRCCMRETKVSKVSRQPTVLSRSGSRRLSNWNPVLNETPVHVSFPPPSAQPSSRFDQVKHMRSISIASSSPTTSAFPAGRSPGHNQASRNNRSWDGNYRPGYSPGYAGPNGSPPMNMSPQSAIPAALTPGRRGAWVDPSQYNGSSHWSP